MKTENLEALLIDREMGELPTATAELLDEYLMHNPAAAARFASLASTLQLARKVIKEPALAVPPPFPREQLQAVQRAGLWRKKAEQTLKLAACLVLGLVAGWFAKTKPNHQIEVIRSMPVTVTQLPRPTAKPVADVGFWSVARLSALRDSQRESAGDEIDHYRLEWDSPVKIPRVEKKL